jgi:predicted aminopeptidase
MSRMFRSQPGGPETPPSMSPTRSIRRRALPVALTAALVASGLSGCANTTGLGYYWQSVSGHLAVMQAARPVSEWLANEATPAQLRERLQLAQRIRRFAVDELALPDNASYRRYAHLPRRAVVYNVTATPELSLRLQSWCFPVAGCVGYRGYFDEAAAQAFAASLDPALDVVVYPVPAYSTLGWMNWAGGDPLLSSFIHYPEGELARLLFHELAHQVLYVSGDMPFNESFATAVERLGGERWLAQSTPKARETYARFDERRQAFRALTHQTRANLQAVYQDTAIEPARQRQHKAAIMTQFRQDYVALRAQWDDWPGYDDWVRRANNASFSSQAAYDEGVPAFLALFEQEGRNFPRFYAAVRALARLPPTERWERLRSLAPHAAISPR